MRNVLRLIHKDLALMLRFAVVLLVAELTLVIMLSVQVDLDAALGPASLIVACVGGFLICLRSTVLEEKNRAFQFIKLLPVSTTEIVLAKFTANVVAVGTNSLLLFLVGGIRLADAAGGWRLDLESSNLATFLAAQWACNAVFVATALAFGSEKAIWTPFALLFVLFNVLLNVEALGLADVADFIANDPTRFFLVATSFVAAMVALSIFAMQRRRVFG